MKRGTMLNGQGKEAVFLELSECWAVVSQQEQQSWSDLATACHNCGDDSGKEWGKKCCDLCFLLPCADLLISPTEWIQSEARRQGDMGDTLLEVSSSTHTAEKTRTERTKNESRGIECRLICIIPFFSFQKIYILKRNTNGAKGFHLHLSLSHLAVWKSNTLQ